MIDRKTPRGRLQQGGSRRRIRLVWPAVVVATVTASTLVPSPAAGDAPVSADGKGVEGVRVEVRDGLTRSLAPEGSGDVALDAPPSTQEGEVMCTPTDGSMTLLDPPCVMFVDRNHRLAVAQQVAISGDGSAGYASWRLNAERVAKYDTNEGLVWEHPGVPPWPDHALGVDADGSVVTAAMRLADIPTTGSAQLVTWRDEAGPEPTNTRTQPLDGMVVTAASADGSIAVASASPPGVPVGGFVVAVYGPGPELAPLWVTTGPTLYGLQGVDISADGSAVAVTTYASTFVYRLPELAPVAVIPHVNGSGTEAQLTGSRTEARLSGDGTYLALGSSSSYQAHLYAWSGTAYEEKWSSNVGHPWITAVAVANDGTVVAGTYSYTGGNAGKVIALAAQDGATLWECLCYRDYVDDVEVTPDGSRAVAVSWGDNSSDPAGDVFTAFEGATGDVVFRLRSGVDEPGSLHSVAISDDGTRVLAAGKAVHARALGNGGQVYGIVLPGPEQ